ncbi:MAG: MAPEG family protein [Gammaproteobacteria bacterium]|jgi:hypothetical protein
MPDIDQSSILVPFLGMILLTFLVWLYMYARRLGYLISRGIDPQAVATPEKAARVIPENVNNASNNLKNLFELPVLFYAVCLYLYVTQQADAVHLACAWGFLLFRVVHSVIQCTANRVLPRFYAYATASVALWIMVIRSAWEALT